MRAPTLTQSVGHVAYNYFGGAVGGPIKKDKLFFFGDFFRSPDHEANNNTLTIPSPTWYTCNGSGYIDLSGALNSSKAAGQVYDPGTGNSSGQGRSAYPNNQIPCTATAAANESTVSNPIVTFVDPVALKLMGLLKAPNYGKLFHLVHLLCHEQLHRHPSLPENYQPLRRQDRLSGHIQGSPERPLRA